MNRKDDQFLWKSPKTRRTIQLPQSIGDALRRLVDERLALLGARASQQELIAALILDALDRSDEELLELTQRYRKAKTPDIAA